ncbi:MAG TPA: hypothetical protein VN620_01110, partial [Candidatus Methylomirabilis sp.]|nr:hypothetical protein [Candidatus Methylomirabilis sp.]
MLVRSQPGLPSLGFGQATTRGSYTFVDLYHQVYDAKSIVVTQVRYRLGASKACFMVKLIDPAVDKAESTHVAIAHCRYWHQWLQLRRSEGMIPLEAEIPEAVLGALLHRR